MTRAELIEIIRKKQSFLCVGLDSEMGKLPEHLLENEDPQFEFNRQIIDATFDLAVAYKPNMAFYESEGVKGWQSLQKTIAYLRSMKDRVFVIADAKRADIGNTSRLYASAFFDKLDVDALTVAPYMGSDSVKPFLEHDGKWVILLALTSNQGAMDFQYLKSDGQYFHEHVLRTSTQWGTTENMMYVETL